MVKDPVMAGPDVADLVSYRGGSPFEEGNLSSLDYRVDSIDDSLSTNFIERIEWNLMHFIITSMILGINDKI